MDGRKRKEMAWWMVVNVCNIDFLNGVEGKMMEGGCQKRPFSNKRGKMFIPKGLLLLFFIFNPIDGEPGGLGREQTIHSTVDTRPGNLTIECSKPLDLGSKYEAFFVMKINTTEGLKDITNCTYADCFTYHWDRGVILKMPVYSDQLFNCSIWLVDEECEANRHIHGLYCPIDIIYHIIHVNVQQE